MFEGVLGEPDDLLDGSRPPRACFHGRVVRHDADGATVNSAPTGDDAVGGQVAREGVRQQPVLYERAGVEQQSQAVADEELVLRLELRLPSLEVAGLGAGGR